MINKLLVKPILSVIRLIMVIYIITFVFAFGLPIILWIVVECFLKGNLSIKTNMLES